MMESKELAAQFACYRDLFPMLQKEREGRPFLYLDSAATTQKPQVVIDAISDFYTHHYGTVNRAVYGLSLEVTERYHRVRTQIATFLNISDPSEIVFTKGTTESLNLLAYCLGERFIEVGDEVMISEIEHHANIVPWQMMCQRKQAHLKVIPVLDNGELDLEAYQALLSDKTKVVAIAQLSNALGTLHPVKKIAGMAHQKGALVVIDGAQGAPHLPVDVQELDIDFYACSGHKLYGPTGVGILYGKRTLLDLLPPYHGGGDMIREVTLDETTYADPPHRFEAGTPPIAEVIGLGAAIQFLTEIGMERIAAWEEFLLQYLTEKLQNVLGVQLIGTAKEKGAIVSFIAEGAHALDLGTLLDFHGIAVRTGHHCAQPTMQRFGVAGTTRVSLGLYNTFQEIDYFIDSLEKVLKSLRQ